MGDTRCYLTIIMWADKGCVNARRWLLMTTSAQRAHITRLPASWMTDVSVSAACRRNGSPLTTYLSTPTTASHHRSHYDTARSTAEYCKYRRACPYFRRIHLSPAETNVSPIIGKRQNYIGAATLSVRSAINTSEKAKLGHAY